MFNKISSIVFTLIIAVSAAAFAQNARSSARAKEKANARAQNAGAACHEAHGALKKATPSVKARQHREHHRIKEGVKSGQLNKEEAKELIEGQKEVREMKKDARADGVVTKEERAELQQKLNEESRKIYEEKHDEDVQKRVQKLPVK